MTHPPSSSATQEDIKHPHKFVNLWQSSEERKQKYWLARSCGANHHHSRRMRDWRLSKIERRFGLEETYNPSTKKYGRNMILNTQNPLPV